MENFVLQRFEKKKKFTFLFKIISRAERDLDFINFDVLNLRRDDGDAGAARRFDLSTSSGGGCRNKPRNKQIYFQRKPRTNRGNSMPECRWLFERILERKKSNASSRLTPCMVIDRCIEESITYLLQYSTRYFQFDY